MELERTFAVFKLDVLFLAFQVYDVYGWIRTCVLEFEEFVACNFFLTFCCVKMDVLQLTLIAGFSRRE